MRVWVAFGIGGGDRPPVATARDEASREASRVSAPVRVLSVDNLSRRAVEGSVLLPGEVWTAPALGIVAERPRAVRTLLAFAGVPMSGRDIRWVRATEPTGADGLADALPDAPDWVPWYPVVDAERCTRCGQCVRFCLFGVYQAGADGLPRVVHPRQCKNLCPACARICPAAAIVFPRYTESPFNGDEVAEDETDRLAARQADLHRLLGDDPVEALRARQQQAAARRASCPGLVDPTRLEAALAERARHLRREAPEDPR